ncbi:MAG: rplM [Candidatus Saccharibacteria bacterium]|jgi:large subunit ribosomal protein L13|nr:rplM [Candidatus Saccharibacteria bacterium]
MKTYSAKPTDVVRAWYVIDASEAPIGRISTRAATLLTGKAKPQFTKHIDCGDHVIVINADKLVATGDKFEKKMYYRHSHFPGGLKEISLAKQVEKDASQAIIHAIRGMLPVNKLRDDRLARLRVYNGSDHKHEAQQPISISIKDVK